jgi:hypothetical protein
MAGTIPPMMLLFNSIPQFPFSIFPPALSVLQNHGANRWEIPFSIFDRRYRQSTFAMSITTSARAYANISELEDISKTF